MKKLLNYIFRFVWKTAVAIMICFLIVVMFFLFKYREQDDQITGCCRLYIGGDPLAVDAEIYIDGKLVGIMEKAFSSNPDDIHRKPDEFYASGIDIRIKTGEKKPNRGVYTSPMIPSWGVHELMFIAKDGTKLTKLIHVDNENYIHVDFEEMIITARSPEDTD